jgi:hypothetical protein
VVPVDQRIEEVAAVSGPLKKYRVTRGGVETVMKLNDADAARLGVGPDKAVGEASTIPPVEPVDEPDGGDGDGAADESGVGQPSARKTAAKKQPASANKARPAAANKAESPGG